MTLVMTCWTMPSGKDGLRLRPGASTSPLMPSNSNRLDHNDTVFTLTALVAAIENAPSPRADLALNAVAGEAFPVWWWIGSS